MYSYVYIGIPQKNIDCVIPKGSNLAHGKQVRLQKIFISFQEMSEKKKLIV